MKKVYKAFTIAILATIIAFYIGGTTLLADPVRGDVDADPIRGDVDVMADPVRGDVD